MSGIPRILAVDPIGALARLVHAVVDLSEETVIQTHVPNGVEALAELKRVPYTLVVSTVVLDEEMDGFALCEQVQSVAPDASVILIGDEHTQEVELTGHAVLLRRPFDPHQFLRIFVNGLEGKDLLAGADTTNAQPFEQHSIPALDLNATSKMIDALLRDVSPLKMLLVTRAGEVLLERGAEKRLNREQLAQALLPAVQSTIHMGSMVGGKITTLNFYDGDTYDIFVLSVGYHHFLCLVFDGKTGGKQIGAVRSYATRTTQDIAALLAGQEYMMPRTNGAGAHKRSRKARPVTGPLAPVASVEKPAEPIAVRAAVFEALPEPEPEPARLQLEPIADLDLSLFDNLGSLNPDDADALFDLDNISLNDLPTVGRERGLISGDEARRLDILK
jgi:CheY-like chemotaxis protein